MQNNDTPPAFKSGFVAIAGRPNVGKSTLLNALLGQKIAAVTYKPQTTRKQQLGILTLDEAQIIFIDTPGIHQPQHKLGAQMNSEASNAFEDANLLLILVDASQPPQPDDGLLAEAVHARAGNLKKIVALNKIDKVEGDHLEDLQDAYAQLFPEAVFVRISAKYEENLAELVDLLLDMLPEGFPFFPEDQLTDQYERDLASDLIREAALLHLRDEIPHSIAVRMDTFQERGETGAFIAATLFVERDSQIGIVVGRKGAMLKRIGTHARKEIQQMSGRKVHLELRVKVRKNWRNDEGTLKRFGFRS